MKDVCNLAFIQVHPENGGRYSGECVNSESSNAEGRKVTTVTSGIRHSVGVTASTLYEAAALAIGEFGGFTADAPGPATRLTVAVKAPATMHEVRVSKIEAWLQSGGRSPNEQAMKVRLREVLGL